ncbi:Structural maintenance of chromosomes flexible hinge domain-containing protein 1, partial [Ophiophagus hannah]
ITTFQCTKIIINVLPNQPALLKPQTVPNTPAVSRVQDVGSRTLDKYDNCTGSDLNGRIVAKIKSSTENEIDIPLFQDYTIQQQMAQLAKEKDVLSKSIKEHTDWFDSKNQRIATIECKAKEARKKESELKNELKRYYIDIPEADVLQHIDSLIKLTTVQEKILKQQRRICTLDNYPKSNPDILGKVSHLAQIEDDQVAKVISWHLASDMDCIVTLTTSAARRIFDETRVFGMLLGNTIIFDNLEAAIQYRNEVVKTTACPTLLTREGDRIRNTGKFGGLSNKAPPIEKLQGVVFGAPLPPDYNVVCQQIELLQQYKAEFLHCTEVNNELEKLRSFYTSEMGEKKEELDEMKDKLALIEQKLGFRQLPQVVQKNVIHLLL